MTTGADGGVDPRPTRKANCRVVQSEQEGDAPFDGFGLVAADHPHPLHRIIESSSQVGRSCPRLRSIRLSAASAISSQTTCRQTLAQSGLGPLWISPARMLSMLAIPTPSRYAGKLAAGFELRNYFIRNKSRFTNGVSSMHYPDVWIGGGRSSLVASVRHTHGTSLIAIHWYQTA